MNRKLRFRAWFVDEMVFSDCATGEFGFVFDNDGNMEFVVWNDEMHKLTPDGDVTYSGWETYTRDIMQCTGLVDVNGDEIWEGDIIEDDDDRIMLVEWYIHGFCFKALTKTNFVRAHHITEWFEHGVDRPKIIGNIYEYGIDRQAEVGK